MGYELTVASQNTRPRGYKKSVKIAIPKLIAVKKSKCSPGIMMSGIEQRAQSACHCSLSWFVCVFGVGERFGPVS